MGEQEGKYVLRDLVQAIGGNVGHGNRAPCRLLDSDVVDADPVPADHLQPLPAAAITRSVTLAKQVRIASALRGEAATELILVARLRDQQACPYRSQHFCLGLDRRPAVVGHEHDPLARVEPNPRSCGARNLVQWGQILGDARSRHTRRCAASRTARRRRAGRLAEEAGARHATATRSSPTSKAHRRLDVGGEYQWRREGELHLFNPETVFLLQHATRQRRYELFQEYTEKVEAAQPRRRHAARAVRVPNRDRPPVPIDEVEPVERRSSSGSPPARCPTARSRPRRTRRSRSR